MPKVSQAYLDARRAEILTAAVACFARQGFHRTTMQDIVAESQLSPGAIYNYFDSKEGIIEAIADERHAREETMIAEARSEEKFVDVMARIRDAFFGNLDDPGERQRRRVGIQLWAEAQRNVRIKRVVQRGVDGPRKLLTELIRNGQKHGEIPTRLDPEAAARFMIAAFHGFVLQLDWDGHAEVKPYVGVLDDLMKRLLSSP